MHALASRVTNALVPFGVLLRSSEKLNPFERWDEVLWRFLPQTFFIYWLFSFIPFVGGFVYMLGLVPLSLLLNMPAKTYRNRQLFAQELLVCLTVVLIGFGGIWSFVGHTFLADSISADIGWEAGSPFQTELAFYSLGLGISGLLAVWLRGHLVTALVISKSVFWFGAAFVHIRDAVVNQNYAPSNIGAPLIGDLLYPTLLLTLLVWAHKRV